MECVSKIKNKYLAYKKQRFIKTTLRNNPDFAILFKDEHTSWGDGITYYHGDYIGFLTIRKGNINKDSAVGQYISRPLKVGDIVIMQDDFYIWHVQMMASVKNYADPTDMFNAQGVTLYTQKDRGDIRYHTKKIIEMFNLDN